MGITIFGIKNCDTMKKARQWLDAKGIAYAFHDYKAQGIDQAHLAAWCKELGWLEKSPHAHANNTEQQ